MEVTHVRRASSGRSINVSRAKMSPWEHVADVESENEPGTHYKISRHRLGYFGCACPSYRFAKKDDKTCKHLAAYRLAAGIAGRAVEFGGVGLDEVAVATDGERFTVRRAISLGGLRA